MTSRLSWLLPRLAAVLVGAALGAATTASPLAPVVLVPFLVLSIGAIVLLNRRDLDIVLWLVCGAAFLLPMNNVRLSSNLTVGDGLATVALLLIVVARTGQRDLRIVGMDKLLIGVVLVVFGGLLGSFFAASIGASLSGLGKFGAATIALPILFGLWRPGLPELRIVAWSTILGSTVSAVVGIVAIKVVGRAQGLTTQPNHLALASLMAVGLALGLLLSSPHRVQGLILLAAIAALSVGIVSSGSRSGLVAEAVVVGIVALITHDRRIILALGLVAMGFVFFLLSGRLTQNGNSALSRLLGGGGANVSDQARAETLHAAFHTFLLHPLTGQGFQTALETHDIVLELAATAGILGLLGIGFVAWISARPLWARYHWGSVRPNRPGDALLVGATAAVIGFFANGLLGNELYDRYIWIVITMAVALAYEIDTPHLSIAPRCGPNRQPGALRSGAEPAPAEVPVSW